MGSHTETSFCTNMAKLSSGSCLLLLVTLMTFAIANPLPQLQLPFPRRGNTPNSRGDYSFSYSNDDQRARQARQESGFETNSVEGSYSFVSPEGRSFSVAYTADRNGYFPRGTGIHPALLMALQHLRKVNGI